MKKSDKKNLKEEKDYKELSFKNLLSKFREQAKSFPDKRAENKSHGIEEVALGAFSVFFTQFPSFLSFQRSMQESKGINNARSLFGIEEIPSDNQIRNILDLVPPEKIFPIFPQVFETLNRSGELEKYRAIKRNLLMPLDGTRYYSSETISCECCSKTKHKNGTITYHHDVVTPVIVSPENNRVISLEPEFIIPQDGTEKEDCENAAAKRWLNKYGEYYSRYGITILGDDLYCKQSLCELMLEKKFNFILVCKPASHKTLYEYVNELQRMGEVAEIVEKRWTGKRHETDTYRFVNQVPLKDGKEALLVNFCELTTTREDGSVKYKNAFATNLTITKENVKEVVKCGRARWKIENENNNVLKTKGYNIEHNYGHGKHHLSTVLLTFNLIAFLFHTVLDLMDEKYKHLRDRLPTRKAFFQSVQALTIFLYFKNWDSLIAFMIQGMNKQFDPAMLNSC